MLAPTLHASEAKNKVSRGSLSGGRPVILGQGGSVAVTGLCMERARFCTLMDTSCDLCEPCKSVCGQIGALTVTVPGGPAFAIPATFSGGR
jgi:hypothetical protein